MGTEAWKAWAEQLPSKQREDAHLVTAASGVKLTLLAQPECQMQTKLAHYKNTHGEANSGNARAADQPCSPRDSK